MCCNGGRKGAIQKVELVASCHCIHGNGNGNAWYLMVMVGSILGFNLVVCCLGGLRYQMKVKIKIFHLVCSINTCSYVDDNMFLC